MAEVVPAPVIVEPKSVISSFTLWLNAVAFLSAIVPWLMDYHNPDGTPFIPPAYYPILVMVVNVANMLIRIVITKAPIAFMVPAEAQRVGSDMGNLKKLSVLLVVGLTLFLMTGVACAGFEAQNMKPRVDGMDQPNDPPLRHPWIYFMCDEAVLDHGKAYHSGGCASVACVAAPRSGPLLRSRLRGTGAAVGRVGTAPVRWVRARRVNGNGVFQGRRRGRGGC